MDGVSASSAFVHQRITGKTLDYAGSYRAPFGAIRYADIRFGALLP